MLKKVREKSTSTRIAELGWNATNPWTRWRPLRPAEQCKSFLLNHRRSGVSARGVEEVKTVIWLTRKVTQYSHTVVAGRKSRVDSSWISFHVALTTSTTALSSFPLSIFSLDWRLRFVWRDWITTRNGLSRTQKSPSRAPDDCGVAKCVLDSSGWFTKAKINEPFTGFYCTRHIVEQRKENWKFICERMEGRSLGRGKERVKELYVNRKLEKCYCYLRWDGPDNENETAIDPIVVNRFSAALKVCWAHTYSLKERKLTRYWALVKTQKKGSRPHQPQSERKEFIVCIFPGRKCKFTFHSTQ